MKYIQRLLLIVAAFTYNPILYADEVITLFLLPYPTVAESSELIALTQNLRNAGVIDEQRINALLHKEITSGFWATYSGYLTVSDRNGQITFPRLQEPSEIYLIITSKATPALIINNTIHHFEFEEGTPAVVYKMTRIHDQYENLFYWDTMQVPIPENNIIPRDSILIFSKPHYFEIPEGISDIRKMDKEMANLVLPPIFVKSLRKLLNNSLYILNLKQFFGPSKSLYKDIDHGYSTLIENAHP